ncbi:MAG: CBS domain-containing protein [Armatimonadota bacterium]|jgi:CBS domain-containing protein
MIARELMQTDVPTLSPDDPIQRAAELLTHYEHSDLAVLDDEGVIIGMVGEDDLLALAIPTAAAGLDTLSYLPRCYGLRSLPDDQLQSLTVADIMRTEGFIVVEDDELAAHAALLMMRNHQPQILVQRDGKYVGRLGRKHIISELVDPHLGVACHP